MSCEQSSCLAIIRPNPLTSFLVATHGGASWVWRGCLGGLACASQTFIEPCRRRCAIAQGVSNLPRVLYGEGINVAACSGRIPSVCELFTMHCRSSFPLGLTCVYSRRVWTFMVGNQCISTKSMGGAEFHHRSKFLDPVLRNYIDSQWPIISLIRKKKMTNNLRV